MPRYYLDKENRYWGKVLLDGFFLLAAFLMVYFIRRGHVRIELNFQRFLPLLFVTWLVVTLLSKKFKKYDYSNLYGELKPYFVSILALTFLLTFVLFVLGWYFLSRFIVYFTIGFFFLFEILFIIGKTFFSKTEKERTSIPFSMVFFLMEILIFIGLFSFVYFYIKRSQAIQDKYLILYLGICFVWILISLLVHRYEIAGNKRIIQAMIPYWKSEILIISMISFFLMVLNLALFSRLTVLGSLIGFSLLENGIVAFLYFLHRDKSSKDALSLLRIEAIASEPESMSVEEPIGMQTRYRIPETSTVSELFKKKLEEVYLHRFPGVFHAIERSIDLSGIDVLKSVILHADDPSQIPDFSDESCEWVMNLSATNNIRHFNRFFIGVNRKLKRGGIFVGTVESMEQSRNRFYRRLSYVPANIFYPFYFFWKRMMPKLPLVRKAYFALSRGRNRVVSLTEIMGRLAFCGFRTLDMDGIDNMTWFIAAKEGTPRDDKNPSYGPLFKQQRVGRNGRMFFAYKFRTMFPYSEYIQKYISDQHHLNKMSKIKDDYRITSWGRVLRRLWIDEIPMIYNIFRREMKFVGVRPLSQAFFSTYPDDLKKQRSKHKPGLIPPFFVDMPDTIKEVWESERRYLKNYEKHPIRTDLEYFFRALKNIFFHHAKSG